MQIGVDCRRAVEKALIFVIDDDEITRAVLQFILHDENEAHESATLAAALEKAASLPPHLLLVGDAILGRQGSAPTVPLKERFGGAKVLAVGRRSAMSEANSEDVEALQAKVKGLSAQATSLKMTQHDLAEELPTGWETIPQVAEEVFRVCRDLADARSRLAGG